MTDTKPKTAQPTAEEKAREENAQKTEKMLCDLRKEAEQLAAINERFDKEPEDVRRIRMLFAGVFENLLILHHLSYQDEVTETTYQAICHLRIARMLAVEAQYLDKSTKPNLSKET